MLMAAEGRVAAVVARSKVKSRVEVAVGICVSRGGLQTETRGGERGGSPAVGDARSQWRFPP